MYRIIPLPYHQQAFIVSKAANLVNFFKPESTFDFINLAYENQYLIYNSVTADKTYNQIIDLVGTWATNGTGVTKSQYYEGMNSSTTNGNTIEFNARYMFKYSVLDQAYATPIFAINGLKVSGLDTYQQWKVTLDSLLSS